MGRGINVLGKSFSPDLVGQYMVVTMAGYFMPRPLALANQILVSLRDPTKPKECSTHRVRSKQIE
jgi:hypothetical protein